MTSTQLSTATHQPLHETDFVEWADQTAELLKQGKFDELDIEHLIEEVEDLGNSERKALRSQLTRLLMHLLKWQYQSDKRSGSWRGSIRESRKQIRRLVRDYPSLKNHLIEKFDLCYQDAAEDAADETGLPLETFPPECPYTAEQTLNSEFLPED
ncbi:DUF29 domain-containing protein [Acaryochloris thomasi]|nr:DUF29 domain-containing protein [Acaryochloris thomasi]